MNRDPILNSIFDNSTNSYKYFWWLAIMELVIEKDQLTIPFDDIVIKIITKMWYPINYFKLSFGKQDQIVNYINELKKEFQLDDNISEKKLQSFLRKEVDHKTINRVSQKITKYVPYRFIRPWFSTETMGLKDHLVHGSILNIQHTKKDQIPYIIDSNNRLIILNSEIKKMIQTNYGILESFTLLKLTQFLEKRNSNIPNISIKLSKPNSRALNKATKIWKKFISLNPEITDVFECKRLKNIENISIDHFLPWSYFSHDEIWNTHPIDRSVNSSKNNRLPSKNYLIKFSKLQYIFLQHIIAIGSTEFLIEYSNMLKVNKNELMKLSLENFRTKFSETYISHFEMAINMGFDQEWKFN